MTHVTIVAKDITSLSSSALSQLLSWRDVQTPPGFSALSATVLIGWLKSQGFWMPHLFRGLIYLGCWLRLTGIPLTLLWRSISAFVFNSMQLKSGQLSMVKPSSAQDKQGQRTLLAVTHISKTILIHKPLPSKKAAEVTQTQILLHESGLEKGKLTLDALHLNPRTTQQINQAGGRYLIQAKGNQSILHRQLRQVEATQTPMETYFTANKGHGRIDLRRGRCFDVSELDYAKRWSDSGFATLIIMECEPSLGIRPR